MLLVFSTFPNEEKAREIVRCLVDERLVACGNLVPSIRSIYRWKGTVHEETEVMVILKISRAAYPEVQKRIRELHPYELPEVVAIPVEAGLPEFLGWIAENSQRPA
jgi:periplasmic divalent cation tolerance protein